MAQPTLAGLALAIAVAVYVALGIAWALRARGDRRAAARLAALNIDPYHAVATAGYPEDVDEAAAAVLITSGTAHVDLDGVVTVSGAPVEGRPRPEHPLPAALLDALDRHSGSAPLRRLVHDLEPSRARTAYLHGQDAKVPGWSHRHRDRLKEIATLTMLVLTLFYAVQIIFLRAEFAPHGVLETLFAVLFLPVLWLMMCIPTAWFVFRFWPRLRDPYRAHCARLPRHPALAALDADQRARLRKSVVYQEKWEAEQCRWVDVDAPGAF
ncbi:hypothetical protein ACWC24_39670 [Streptomyces sp. NPDC001443]